MAQRFSGLLALPAEIRCMIYSLALKQGEPIITRTRDFEEPICKLNGPRLLATNRQIRNEANPVFYRENTFVLFVGQNGWLRALGTERCKMVRKIKLDTRMLEISGRMIDCAWTYDLKDFGAFELTCSMSGPITTKGYPNHRASGDVWETEAMQGAIDMIVGCYRDLFIHLDMNVTLLSVAVVKLLKLKAFRSVFPKLATLAAAAYLDLTGDSDEDGEKAKKGTESGSAW